MDLRDVARLRLRNQRVSGAKWRSAAEVVGWLGAVQSQEYPLAKWTLGMRASGLGDAAVDEALADGSILRTHVLRPTWHFVLPADIRWMVALTAPRVLARIPQIAAPPIAQERTVQRGLDVMRDALAGGRRLSRDQVRRLLVERGIVTDASQVGSILIRAELDLVVCSGGLAGRQQTYALLDDRAPPLASFDREWALGELTRRYFTSHGPATIPDFRWWSSLRVADAKRGIEINGSGSSSTRRGSAGGGAPSRGVGLSSRRLRRDH